MFIDEKRQRPFVAIQKDANHRISFDTAAYSIGVSLGMKVPWPFAVDVHGPAMRIFSWNRYREYVKR